LKIIINKNYILAFVICVCFFLAHLAKGNVSFCHHLASVVSHQLTFYILIFSSETPQPNEVKLASGFREEDFFKSANQKQELPMAAMFVKESELNEQSL
jgi:hypothetical protein